MTKDNPSIGTFKAWIFPTLVSLVSLLIWNDVNEIKSDVKLLMAQSNIDKTRIDNIERQLFKASNTIPSRSIPKREEEITYAVLVDNKIKFRK
jgi:hypothetical protein